VGTLDALHRFTTLDFDGGDAFTYVYPPGPGTLPETTVRPDDGVQEMRRDELGRLTQLTVNGQVVRAIRYDALGQIASVDEGGEARTFGYDGAGRRNRIAGPDGTLDITYDAAGRATEYENDAGEVTIYEYDAADRPVAMEDGDGRRMEMTYDESSRLTQVTDPLDRGASLAYDANGRLAQMTHFGGQTVAWTYLPTDQGEENASVATLTDADGVTWSYGYDPERNLDEVVDPLGGVTSYEYTAGAQLTKVVDALDRETVLTYSDAGLASKTTPGLLTESWTYDAFGRVATWRRGDGSLVTYQYDGETTTVRLPSGAAHVSTRDHDAGLFTSSGTAAGILVEQEGSRDKVTLVMLADGGKVEMRFTTSGRVERVTATTPGGAVFETGYAYDSGGRLVRLDAPGGPTAYSYDDAGRLRRIDRPNGVVTTLGYLDLDRPVTIEHSRGGAVLDRQDLTYDARGRLVRRAGADGTFEYEYDGLTRLAVEREAGVGETTYLYDAVGNMIRRTLPDGDEVSCSYDADDRLLSCDTPDGTETYFHDDRGARTGKVGPAGTTTYEYDDLDRLVRVTTPEGGDVRYEYDVKGRLLGRDDGTGRRRCLPLPATPRGFDDCALSYSTSGPEAPTAYVFGPQGIASVHSPVSTGYVLAGSQGQVNGVADSAGSVTAEASYEAWGRPSPALPSAFGGYGYTGERQDPVTGLVFLRQRWYDPATGRFLTPDTVSADGRDPRSLNRYVYALANPVNNTDPTGGFTLGEVNVVQSINNTLQQMRTVAVRCIGEEVKGEIFQALGEWAAHEAAGLLFGSVGNVLEALGPNPLENPFHNVLFDVLCHEDSLVFGAAEFEVRITSCGEFGSARSNSGNAALTNCLDGFRTHNGVDILLYGIIPVEVKRTSSSAGPTQLQTYCRFASNRGSHVALYIYWRLPTEAFNEGFAKQCWRCWNRGTNCDGRPALGSVYGAIGILGNNEGKHTYVPDLSLCGKP
jgi:RHS repeat-associated protein